MTPDVLIPSEVNEWAAHIARQTAKEAIKASCHFGDRWSDASEEERQYRLDNTMWEMNIQLGGVPFNGLTDMAKETVVAIAQRTVCNVLGFPT